MRLKFCSQAAIALMFVAALAPAGDSTAIAEAEQKLETLSAAEKDELRRRHERFQQLSESERQRLRQLEADIANDPHEDRLRELMLRYHEWLRGLPSSQRSEINTASSAERIEKIKLRLAEQEKRRREELASQSINREDISTIRTWLKPIFKRSELKLLAKLPPDHRRNWDHVAEHARFGGIMGAVIWTQRADNYQWRLTTVMGITDNEIEELVQRLSSTARGAYKNAATEPDRNQLVETWIRSTVFSEMRRFSPYEMRRFADRVDPKSSNRMRDEFDYLPPNQMRTEFEGMFRDRNKTGPGPFPPFNHPKGDPRERGRSEK